MADNDVPLPISFDAEKPKEEYSRGSTMVQQRSVQQNQLNLNTKQFGKSSASSTQTKQFGGKAEEVMTLELDDASTKQKGSQTAEIYAVEVMPEQENVNKNINKSFDPEVYNEITSHSVPNQDCKQVLDKLSNVLSSYSNEIDFEVDSDANQIKNGVVFMNNYYSVFFMIYVVAENDKITRFELRRNSGDALASAKFLGDIKAQFFGTKQDDDAADDDDKEQETEKEENTLIALDLNVNDLELKLDENEKERMMIHEALISDDYVGDVDEKTENFLYGKLLENKVISEKIVDHKLLCKTLMDKQFLLHDDICVVRASLLILTKFGNKYPFVFSGDSGLFELLNDVLQKQKYSVVKKAAIGLLAKLAENEEKWNLNDSLKKNLNETIKDFENKCKNKKYFKQSSFDAVYKKL